MKDQTLKIATVGAARIRVLELIGNAITGGMERSVRDLIRSLPRERFEILCICPYESAFTDQLRTLGCDVYITPIRDDPPWCAIELAATIVRSRKVDIIHAHLMNAHTLAAIVGALTATPIVATIHSMTLTAQEIGVARLGESHLVTLCQQAFAQALAAGIRAPRRLSLIPNGVDLDRFRPAGERAGLREALGVPADGVLVGFVGRLSPEKGPDKFVWAAQKVLERRRDVRFLLVGDGPERPRLADIVARAGLEDHIRFAGTVERTDQVYPALDIFVQTSRSEAMPLALMEAMACGLPAIAIAVGGVAEIIAADETGILISPVEWPGVASPYAGDWPGVAEALPSLIDDAARRTRMGGAARRRVEQHFDLKLQVERIAALFQRLARDARVAAPTASGAVEALDRRVTIAARSRDKAS